jgi:hypothetical protein
LKGWTTGRETQRGPKTAREQAVSREKWVFCQMKGADLGGWSLRSVPIAAQLGGDPGFQSKSGTVLIDDI